MHPLFNQDLSELDDDALHKKQGEVLKRITQASRLGYADAVFQMQMILGHYNNEILRRNAEKLDKLNKNGADLDSYIDIG